MPTRTATAVVASPTATLTPPPSVAPATATRPPPTQSTPTPLDLPTLPLSRAAVRGWSEGSLLALDVPIRSQFDSSDYQASNCGPTSLAMVLESFGVVVPTYRLRNLANLLQGTYERETGIALDYLAEIAREAGLRAYGLRDGAAYRRWSVDDVRAQVRSGHPVVTLVRMRELPDHAQSRSDTDHYVVVVGLDGDHLLINDPARPGDTGFRRPLTAEQIERAWDTSSIPRQAISVGAGEGVPELRFAAPTLTPARANMAAMSIAPPSIAPGSTLPLPVDAPDAAPAPAQRRAAELAAPAMPGSPEASVQGASTPTGSAPLPAGAAVIPEPVAAIPGSTQGQSVEPPGPAVSAPGSGQIVVVITPQAPIIVVNVAMPSAPTVTAIPSPTVDRWARPGAPAPGAGDWARPSTILPTDGRWSVPTPVAQQGDALVLAETLPAPGDSPLRWLARLALVACAGAALRWAMK